MDVFQHFREDERPFVQKVIDWAGQAEEKFVPRLTDFLDPREQYIIESLISGNQGTSLHFFGGYRQAERKRAQIVPPFQEAGDETLQLQAFDIHYPVKFATLKHRDVLGALLNLGLGREKFGDLIISGEKIQFIAASEIADFVEMNFTQAANHKISCSPIPLADLEYPDETWSDEQGSVSSFRLDVLIGEIYRISRSKATALIKNGSVKVNWKVVEKPSYECQISDTISTRGFGRAKFLSSGGTTRKGNIWIQYGRLQ